MRRNKTAEVSVLVVFAFIAGLLAYEPFTNVLVSSKGFVQDRLSSRYSHEEHQDDQIVSPDFIELQYRPGLAEKGLIGPITPVQIHIS